jgi:hypothetical protein
VLLVRQEPLELALLGLQALLAGKALQEQLEFLELMEQQGQRVFQDWTERLAQQEFQAQMARQGLQVLLV